MTSNSTWVASTTTLTTSGRKRRLHSQQSQLHLPSTATHAASTHHQIMSDSLQVHGIHTVLPYLSLGRRLRNEQSTVNTRVSTFIERYWSWTEIPRRYLCQIHRRSCILKTFPIETVHVHESPSSCGGTHSYRNLNTILNWLFAVFPHLNTEVVKVVEIITEVKKKFHLGR